MSRVAPKQGFASIKMFDHNLLPYPFERIEVISRDGYGNFTVLDFYDDVPDIKSINENFGGTRVFRMYIKRNENGDWYDVAIKKFK